MISPAARHFAKFARKATPKHGFKAFSSLPNGFRMNAKPSISSLSALLNPIPPTLSLNSLGSVVSSSRLISTSAGEVEGTKSDAMIVDANEDLDALLESSSSKNTVVDFHASWCGPCRILGPLLESQTRAHGLKLIKVDVDTNQEAASKWNIVSLPTVIVVRDGKEVGKFIGSRSKSMIDEFLLKFKQ